MSSDRSGRVPFRDLVEFAIGGGWGAEEPEEGTTEVRVVRGTDLATVRGGSLDGVPRRFETHKKVAKRTLERGDLVLEISGGSRASGQATGRAALMTDRLLDAAHGVPIIPASFCRLLRVKRDVVEPEYAFLLLCDMHSSGRAFSYQNDSTGISNFQLETFLDAEQVWLPALEEQRSISRVLGALDAKIASNRRLALATYELIDALCARALLDAQRTPGSSQQTVAELCESKYGFTASATHAPLGPRFLRVKDINKRPWIEWDEVPYCEADDQARERFGLRHGDIVVARMADPGKVAYCVMPPNGAVCASYLVRLRPADEMTGHLLFGFLRSSAYQRDYVTAAVGGSVQKNMNAKVITAAALAVPAQPALEALSSQVGPLLRKAARAVSESARLAAVRDALLPRLVSGQLRVRDVTDDSDGAVAE